MKKRITFIKMLLVAALLGVGSSAWGEDIEFTQVASYDFSVENATDPFTNRTWSNRQTSTLEQDATLGTKAVVFKGANLAGKTSGYHTLDFTDLTGSSSQVKVEFDFYVNEANINRFALRDASIAEEPTKDVWKGTGAIFSIGCARVKEGGVNVNRFGYNGVAISDASFATPYHVSIIVDVVNKKVSYTLKKLSDNSTVASGSNIAFADANATVCTRLDFHGATNTTMAAINNIVISEYTSSSATTYSVIKYDKDGNELFSTSDLVGVAGETSSVTVADKATFYSVDTNSKYVFDESDERNVTSLELTSTEATNVLKLYFNTYTKYTATVSSVCGDNSVADITGSWYADEDPKTLYWPKVVSCSDGYYIVNAEESTPYYGHTFSTSDLIKTVTYKLDEDIVYYAEYENILTNKNSYEYFTAQSSKGTSRCIQKTGVMKTAMGLESTGVYDVIFACGNRDLSHTATLDMKLIDSQDNISTENVIYATFVSNEWKGELTANNVTIPAGSELYFANDNGEGNARIAGDYILVRKSYLPLTVTSAGWATLYTQYALDFSSLSSELTAYTATLEGSTVTLNAVDEVPANTGVVLKGAAKEYSIPVIVSSETEKGDLKGSATDALTYDENAENDYYLLKLNGKSEAQFSKLTSGTIAAGKAYLQVAKSNEARVLSVVFGNGTTGIANVDVNDNDNLFFDLQGRKVTNPTKGLYIMRSAEGRLQGKNGKKVVVK